MNGPATSDGRNDPFCDAYWQRGPGKDRDPQRKCSREASDVAPVSGLDLEIKRLALLGEAAYESERKSAAKNLGVRTSILDKLVAAAWPPDESAPGSGRPLKLPEPEPWPSPINGAALASELTSVQFGNSLSCVRTTRSIALWVLHAFCFDVFACAPRLAITAPEKRCGKTTLLDVIALLVPKALPTANISAAATFRTIEAVRPVLSIDEADTFLSVCPGSC